jgi:four helix bundle protein
MRTHKDLDIWKEGIDFVEEVYKITQNFPSSEKYNLISQIRRSAVSFVSNIAEGAARTSKKEYIRFISISLGSLSELETQLIIRIRLGYIDSNETLLERLSSLRKRTYKFKNYLLNREKL